jgi:hypothetical protein
MTTTATAAKALIAPTDFLLGSIYNLLQTSTTTVSTLAMIIGYLGIILSAVILISSVMKFRDINKAQVVGKQSMIQKFGSGIWTEILIWIGCNAGVLGFFLVGLSNLAFAVFLAYGFMLIFVGWKWCGKNWFMIASGLILTFMGVAGTGVLTTLLTSFASLTSMFSFVFTYGSLIMLALSFASHYKSDSFCKMKSF